MSANDLISRLERLGIRLWIENNRLHYDAPTGTISKIQAQLIHRKSEIIKHLLKVEELRKSKQPVLRPMSRPSGKAPMSFVQRRLWFLDQLEPGSSTYNIPSLHRFEGELHVAALEASLNALIKRHETLRTHFELEKDDPVQVITPALKISLLVDDLASLPDEERELELQKRIQSESNTPFNLAQGPLLRARLFKLATQTYVLAFTLHHIIFDGWSMDVLIRELSVLYDAYSQGKPSPLPALPVQYADYTAWQHDWLQGEKLKKQLSYWREQLKDLPVLDLPTDRPRPAIQRFRGAQVALVMTEALTQKLEKLSQQVGGTMFMTLLAAFQVLLQRYSGQDDIAIGSPIAGRNKVEIESLIGFFVNTLVLRTDLSGNPTFMELLGRVREVAVGAYAHQDLPFDKLVEEIQPKRDLSRNPLFDVMINYIEDKQDTDNVYHLPNLSIFPIKLHNELAKFTFTLYIRSMKGRLHLNLVYQADIFYAERMHCLLQQFEHLLEQIVVMPDQSIHTYSLVTPQSRDRLPDPSAILDEPVQKTVCELFSDAAARSANNVAVSQNKKQWAYNELKNASLRLAVALNAQGVESGDVIAITGPRSFGLIVSILATLRAGAVMLPVDKNLPLGRQEIMLREARVSKILNVGGNIKLRSALKILSVDTETGRLKDNDINDEFNLDDLPVPHADGPAYIFFTSGSTGIPKAVLGCHKSLSHFLGWQREQFSIGPDDRVAQLTSLSFDVVLRDIFLPLTSGGALCLPEENDLINTLHWAEREDITVMHSVPAITKSWLANALDDISLRSLRWLFLAGEPLTGALVRQWRSVFPQSGTIVNLYGATETTLVKCFNQLGDEIEDGIQLAGDALPQTQALVLQHNRQLCGIGETGEIVIRTPFMTLGYLNNLEENSLRFVKNPFRDDERDLLYFTGDRGRYRADGKLEILGRLDDQVKIRGIRIEPAEVAAALSQHNSVSDCAVLAQKNKVGDNVLIAYVTRKENSSITAEKLREDLGEYFQDAFIPSVFVFLEQLPILPNGKIDRKALFVANLHDKEPTQNVVMPQTPVEKILAEVWQAVLGIDQIGIHDNFFDLGGHSLLMTQVVYRISADIGVDIPLVDFFRLPTIHALSIHVSETMLASMDQSDI